MDDQDEKLANFTAITGSDPVSARGILEATGYDLEQAVGLYFAQQADEGSAARSSTAATGPSQHNVAQARGASFGAPDSDEVRAPLPVMRDRLYGADFAMPGRPRGFPRREANQVDAFRDFRPRDYGERDPEASAAGQQGLAGLFEPPHDILFTGSFEQAKEAAQGQERWLLVNVQSNSEFASHMLNRDVWRDETVKNIIKVGFVLYQVQDSSEAGNKVKSFYRLSELPVILVVEPITGAALRTWTGAIEANRLLEELVPFMDHSINDPEAMRMSGSQHKRKQPSAKAPQAAPMTEDEELAMALAMSAETEQQPPSMQFAPVPSSPPASASAAPAATLGAPAAPTHSNPEKPKAVHLSSAGAEEAKPSEKVPEPAAVSLPPEPAAGDPSGCNIAVRFPDGQRRQRRFPREAPISVVVAFCHVSNEEAAAGRSFTLAQPFPGAPAMDDMSMSLEDAKLANTMLVMRWRS
ncbi:g7413 [Coccomyxa viridis]|uniref:G7413 protein n=1 Tax=Coccomyxa viridis TaxID=1274662 RepID=A0ABP1G0C1_9CHLO